MTQPLTQFFLIFVAGFYIEKSVTKGIRESSMGMSRGSYRGRPIKHKF